MQTPATLDTRQPHNGYLWALGAASFASSAALRLCDAMLPALAREFHVSLSHAAWAISAYALAYGVLQLVYGTLGDRHGKWHVVTWATLACTVGNSLAAWAPSLDVLIAARVISGAAAAAIIPLSMALIGDRVPVAERQLVLARFLTATITGMIAGQWASGGFADTLGWRWAFGSFALLFAAIGITMRVAGPGPSQASLPRVGPASAFAADLSRVLREPRVRGVLGVTLLQSALAFGAMTFVPAFLHQEFGLSLRAAAGVVVLYGVGGLVYAWAVAPRLHRLGGGQVMVIGAWLLALTLGALWAAPHWQWVLPACLLGGVAFYALQSLLNMEATLMFPALSGTAVSVFAAALFGGIALGVSLAGWLVGVAGYRAVFALAAIGIALVGTVYGRVMTRRAAKNS